MKEIDNLAKWVKLYLPELNEAQQKMLLAKFEEMKRK